jgi:hypothetical protein
VLPHSFVLTGDNCDGRKLSFHADSCACRRRLGRPHGARRYKPAPGAGKRVIEPHATSSLVKADIAKQLMEHVERGLENSAAHCEPNDHDADRRGCNIDCDKQDGSIF